MSPQDRIAELEAEVRLLKAALGLGARFPSIFQFTKREQKFLGVLTTRRIMTLDMMLLAAYGECVDGGPLSAINVLRVEMVRLRRKLKRFGIAVKTLYGTGYEIDEHAQKLLKELMTTE